MWLSGIYWSWTLGNEKGKGREGTMNSRGCHHNKMIKMADRCRPGPRTGPGPGACREEERRQRIRARYKPQHRKVNGDLTNAATSQHTWSPSKPAWLRHRRQSRARQSVDQSAFRNALNDCTVHVILPFFSNAMSNTRRGQR